MSKDLDIKDIDSLEELFKALIVDHEVRVITTTNYTPTGKIEHWNKEFVAVRYDYDKESFLAIISIKEIVAIDIIYKLEH